MKYNFIFIIFFLLSCSNTSSYNKSNVPYTSRGFALIYNENDLAEKLISDLNETTMSNDLPVENINILGKEILENTYKEIEALINR